MSQLKVDNITDELGTGAPDFPNGVVVNNWTVSQDGSGNLIFSSGANARMKLDASGNLTVTGDVTAFGTI